MAERINLADNVGCCGCTACMAACPKGCIAMERNAEGFLYPRVDGEACASCGLCVKACPLRAGRESLKKMPVARSLVATNADESVRAASTSGGAFNALARQVLEEGGVVFGAAFDDRWRVVHTSARDDAGLISFSGSKYVQSDLADRDVYRSAADLLDKGTPVLFSGTPCQVAGLNTFLSARRVKAEGLTTVDFICRAVPSPAMWEEYVAYLSERYGSKPSSVSFRKKTYGYHSSTMSIAFENGKLYRGSGRVCPMHKAFFAGLSTRPSCAHCAFRAPERASDLTLFDCWSYASLTGLADDDRGHTHVWARTTRASEMLSRAEAAGELKLVDVDMGRVLKGDGVMATRDFDESPRRADFFARAEREGFLSAADKYAHVSMKDRAVESAKGVLSAMGLMRFLTAKRRGRASK